ncbi:MAG: nitrogenase component 1 [Methanoregulaceae archaeon]
MPEADCNGPLWPCALTGAASCLAGFSGLAVVIHGSSGCYYYPATFLKRNLYGTFLVESDLVMGGEERLRAVLRELPAGSGRPAIITSCAPEISGEDVRACTGDFDPIIVESPGFCGGAEIGHALAMEALNPSVDPAKNTVNIDGITLLDPFHRGNLQELNRLLTLIGAEAGTVFCMDRYESVSGAAPRTITANPDFTGAPGKMIGGTLGFDATLATFARLTGGHGAGNENYDLTPLENEVRDAEERAVYACDRFLRRFDPPRTLVFGTPGYAAFAAETLVKYLDAEIPFIGTRSKPGNSRFPAGKMTGFEEAAGIIEEHSPDLVIGSSFERTLAPDAAFVGITPPVRGQVRLRADPLAGIEGTLWFLESVLNACIDHSPQ